MDESIFITAAESGERIDALLARTVEGLSRSAAQHLIADGLVLRCGEPVELETALPEYFQEVLSKLGNRE